MSEHTSGPWKAVVYEGDQGHYTVEQDRETNGGRDVPVAAIYSRFVGHGLNLTNQDEANARLIAAAPDMLAELKRLEWSAVNDRMGDPEWCPSCGCCRDDGHMKNCTLAAAIAKATQGS